LAGTKVGKSNLFPILPIFVVPTATAPDYERSICTAIPHLLEERLELGTGELRFPASLEEFADLLTYL